MKNNTNKCLICPRGCDLSAPHCDRGKTYAKTGKLPESHHHHGAHRLMFDNQKQQLVMKYLHHAVGAADNGGIPQEKAEEMFSVLTSEETAQLAEMLEKLSEHWMKLSPNKPHHGHHHSHH